MSNEYIGISVTTGKIHMCLGSVTHCNYSGQRRISRNRVASDYEIASADESKFCKKCFPMGKPEKQS